MFSQVSKGLKAKGLGCRLFHEGLGFVRFRVRSLGLGFLTAVSAVFA